MVRVMLPPRVIPPELLPFVDGLIQDEKVWALKPDCLDHVCALLLLRGCEQDQEDPLTITTPDGETVMVGDWLWIDDYLNL